MATQKEETLETVTPKKTVTKSVKKEVSNTDECCKTSDCTMEKCTTKECSPCTKLCTIVKHVVVLSILICSAASVFMLCKIYNLEVLKAGGEENFQAMQEIMNHPLYIEDKTSYIQATKEQIEKAGQEPQVDAMQPDMQEQAPVSGTTVQTAPAQTQPAQTAPVQTTPTQTAPMQPVQTAPTQPVVR